MTDPNIETSLPAKAKPAVISQERGRGVTVSSLTELAGGTGAKLPKPDRVVAAVQKGVIKTTVQAASSAATTVDTASAVLQGARKADEVSTAVETSRFNRRLDQVKEVLTHVPSFADRKEEFADLKGSELRDYLADVLKKPAEIIKAKFPQYSTLLEGDKPLSPFEISRKIEESGGKISHELITSLGQHADLASVLNQEFCSWRRYTDLNLNALREHFKHLSRELMQAITFIQTVIRPQGLKPLIESQKFDSTNVDLALIKGFLDTSRYMTREAWEAHPSDEFGRQFGEKGVNKMWTYYNRGRTYRPISWLNQTRVRPVEVVSQKAVAVIQKIDRKRVVKIYDNSFSGRDVEKAYRRDAQTLQERILQSWYEHNGDVREVQKVWKSWANELSGSMEDAKLFDDEHFWQQLTEVATIPCMLLPSVDPRGRARSGTGLDSFQARLSLGANELRRNYGIASDVFFTDYDESGNIGICGNFTHDTRDGGEAEGYETAVLGKALTYLGLSTNPQILTPVDVDLKKISPSAEELTHTFEYAGNYTVEALIDTTEIYHFCIKESQRARTALAGRTSRITNPAVIFQMIVTGVYPRIYAEISRDKAMAEKSVGMLIGNKDLTGDLDLFPIQGGFDVATYMTLPDEGKNAYLVYLADQLDTALANSNMKLIKQTADAIPSHIGQAFLNSISKLWALSKGLSEISGRMIISMFPLPRSLDGTNFFVSPGPAKTDQQDIAVTLGTAGVMSDLEGNRRHISSLRVKDKKNQQARQFAVKMKEYLEKEINPLVRNN